MRLAQAILFVDDMNKMLAFYRDALGLTVKEGTAGEGFVRLVDDGGGAVLALHSLPKAKQQAEPALAREDARTKLCFHVDDRAAIERESARLATSGARMRDVMTFDGISICDGLDPEGNVFQLTTRR